MDSIQQRQCRHCQQFFPATSHFFYPAKRYIGGLDSRCIKCESEYRAEVQARKHPKPEKPALPLGCKICTKCNVLKPDNRENFRPYPKNRPPGFFTICRECMNKRDTERTHGRHQVSPPTFDEKILKECVNCHNSWPATLRYFHRTIRKVDGLMPECKVCRSMRAKESREKNGERERAQKSAHREKNRETLRAKGRDYVKAHPAEANARWHKYDARKRQAKGTHTAKEVREQYDRQKGKCYYCQKRLKWGEHTIDHVVPISRGGSNDISNIVIACPTCNYSKNDRLPHEWPKGGRLF